MAEFPAFFEPEVDDRLPERIARKLRDAIVQGQVQPGERLNEADLAKAFGTSRTPVREAIRHLASSGLVVVTPRRGARVTNVTPEMVSHNYLCRAELYGLAASIAALNHTAHDVSNLRDTITKAMPQGQTGNHLEYLDSLVEFGDILVEISRVPELFDLLTLLKGPSLLIRYQAASAPGRASMVLERYGQVVDAIERGDSMLARELMSRTIRESGCWLLSSKFPDLDRAERERLHQVLSLPGELPRGDDETADAAAKETVRA